MENTPPFPSYGEVSPQSPLRFSEKVIKDENYETRNIYRPVIVNDMSKKNIDFEFTHLACDQDANRILTIASQREVSIKEISDVLGIPMSRCYRRVHEMLDKGMLRVDKIDENRASHYRSNLRSFFITFENESLVFQVEFNDGDIQSFSYDVDPMSAIA